MAAVREVVRDSRDVIDTAVCYPSLPALPAPTAPLTPIESRLPAIMSAGQKLACRAAEELTGHEFQFNVRPHFMRNPATGRNLELDCYNEVLQVAVEYNGEQHYIFPHHFHRDQQEYEALLARDALKMQRCEQLHIHLIVVPYTLRGQQIKEYVRQKLMQRYAFSPTP